MNGKIEMLFSKDLQYHVRLELERIVGESVNGNGGGLRSRAPSEGT